MSKSGRRRGEVTSYQKLSPITTDVESVTATDSATHVPDHVEQYGMHPSLRAQCIDLCAMPHELAGEDAQVWLATFLPYILTGTPKEPDFSPKVVPWQSRCPSCWHGNGGVGKQYSTNHHSGTQDKVYVKCDQCGHTWNFLQRKEVTKVHWNLERAGE